MPYIWTSWGDGVGAFFHDYKVYNILRFRNRIGSMDDKNWTGKTKVLLESIRDFSGLLSCDEIWDSLAK